VCAGWREFGLVDLEAGHGEHVAGMRVRGGRRAVRAPVGARAWGRVIVASTLVT
jgi:hypothetical protein